MDVRNLLEPTPTYNGIGLALGASGWYLCAHGPQEWYTFLAGGLAIVAGGTSWICNDVCRMFKWAKVASEAKIAESYIGSESDHAQQAVKTWTETHAKPEPVIPVFVDGKPANSMALYSTTVQQEQIQIRRAVRVDAMEQGLAQTLVDQKAFNGVMNISESFWIRDGHWKGTPEQFRAVRGKWQFYNIVEKKSDAANSKYRIVNDGAVERIARGMFLPPPPSL